MASSAGVPSGPGQGGGGGNGDGGAGGGGKGNGYGTSPTSWHFNFGSKGKGKKMQVRATGPRSEVQHSLSLPHPEAISITSHMNIDSDGTIEDASVTAQLEFTGEDGTPRGVAVVMSVDSEGTSNDPTWLDGVKADVVTWRE